MDKEAFLAVQRKELADLEARWRTTQDLRAIAEAFDLCAVNEFPLPDWMHPAIRQALAISYLENGPEGKQGVGGYRDLANRQDMHERRHRTAAWALQMRDTGELAGWSNVAGQEIRNTRKGAFDFASWFLRGTAAQGTPETMERSFDRIQRQNRPKNTHG